MLPIVGLYCWGGMPYAPWNWRNFQPPNVGIVVVDFGRWNTHVAHVFILYIYLYREIIKIYVAIYIYIL